MLLLLIIKAFTTLYRIFSLATALKEQTNEILHSYFLQVIFNDNVLSTFKTLFSRTCLVHECFFNLLIFFIISLLFVSFFFFCIVCVVLRLMSYYFSSFIDFSWVLPIGSVRTWVKGWV